MQDAKRPKGKRAKMRIGTRDIAAAAGVGYRTALAAELGGEYTYGDLASVSAWVAGRARK